MTRAILIKSQKKKRTMIIMVRMRQRIATKPERVGVQTGEEKS